MQPIRLVWLEAVEDKLADKHNVMRWEVEEVLANGPLYRFVEKGQRRGEDVYAALGQTDAGRYLIVYFIYKQDRRGLVLSARDMAPRERRQYERR